MFAENSGSPASDSDDEEGDEEHEDDEEEEDVTHRPESLIAPFWKTAVLMLHQAFVKADLHQLIIQHFPPELRVKGRKIRMVPASQNSTNEVTCLPFSIFFFFLPLVFSCARFAGWLGVLRVSANTRRR